MSTSDSSEPRRGRGRRSGQSVASNAEVPWQMIDPDMDADPPPLPFTEPVGPTSALPQSSVPLDSFLKVVSQSIVEKMVEETNK